MSEELIKKLRGIAISKEHNDFAYGRKAPLYGRETEIEWEAATLIEEQAARIAEAEKDYHEERKARYAAQSELVASQARLSEAVKVLESVAEAGKSWNDRQNMEAFLMISNSIEAAKAFITTLGEEKE